MKSKTTPTKWGKKGEVKQVNKTSQNQNTKIANINKAKPNSK